MPSTRQLLIERKRLRQTEFIESYTANDTTYTQIVGGANKSAPAAHTGTTIFHIKTHTLSLSLLLPNNMLLL